MDYLTKKYKEKCKELFDGYNFRIYNNNFYRVINDVFQSFNLHKSVSGCDCIVEFGVVMLCEGNGVFKSRCQPYRIKQFDNRDYSWFHYDRNDEKSMDECVEQMLSYIKKYLIPYFEKTDNSEDAYYAICDFQEKYCMNGILLSDYSLFCAALKSGLYDKCLIHAKARKQDVEYAYKRNKEFYEPSEEYKNSIFSEISEIQHQIKMIEQRNMDYIERFITENEKRALSNLGINDIG